MIKVWHSYSCNNSTSYRLVARFADAEAARATATELHEYFEAQERLGDHRYQAGPLATLARTYGFDWEDGGAGSAGPAVLVENDVVVVYQTYCLGLGPGVKAFLEDRGAKSEKDTALDVQVSALIRFTDAALAGELEALHGKVADPSWRAPWAKYTAKGSTAWFRDSGMIGIYFAIKPADIAPFKRWLVERGAAQLVLRVEERSDETLFRAIAAARCSACGGGLDYLDPRLHDIETPQLVCRPCGGLYDLATFVPG